MKNTLTIESRILELALDRVIFAIAKKNRSSILQSVLLSISRKNITLSATNMNYGSSVVIDYTSNCFGEITINAKLLRRTLKTTTPGVVTISFNNNDDDDDDYMRIVTIECNGHIIYTKSFPAEDFPLEKIDNVFSVISLFAVDIKTLVERTSFAISKSKQRLNLNGVFLHTEKDGFFSAIATDGYRLSYYKTPFKPSNFWHDIILPRKFVICLPKFIGENNCEQISISQYGNFKDSISFVIVTNDSISWSRGVDLTFPDYQRVIPKITPETGRVTFNSSHAIKALDKLIVNEYDELLLKICNKKITLQVGTMFAHILCDTIFDEYIMCFNAKYILDALTSIKPGNVTLFADDNYSAITLQSNTDPQHFVIIMTKKHEFITQRIWTISSEKIS